MTGIETALILGTVATGAMSAVSAIQTGNAASSAANYQAQIDDRNVIIANQDRIQAIRTAQIDAEDKRRENRRYVASMINNFGSSGLGLSGSPLEVLQDSGTEMALDERRIEYEGKVRGREGALRMLGLQEDAAMSRAAGKNAKSAGRINALSSIVDTGTSIAKYKAGV